MVAGIRSLIAGTALWIVFRPKLLPLNKIKLLVAASYALTVISFVAATKWTSAANAILLQSSAPIYIAMFGGIFLNENLKRIDVFSIVIVLLGMLCFFGDELSLSGMRGNILGLVSGFAFASFILFTRKFQNESAISMIVWGNFLAASISLPFAFGSALPSQQDWFGLLGLGIFQLALPYALYSKAIVRVRAIDAILILLIEPVLNPIWVFLILGELPGPWAVGGGVVVLGAVTFRSFVEARNRPPH